MPTIRGYLESELSFAQLQTDIILACTQKSSQVSSLIGIDKYFN